MQAKEIPLNDIQYKEYFAVVYRIILPYLMERPQVWSFSRLCTDEESADLYIIEQFKFS